MKTINIAEFKAHLSEYLARARDGERIVVRDRKVPIVEIIALKPAGDVWQRLAREKGVRLGTQSSEPFKASPTRKQVDWKKFLRQVQEDTL